MMANNGSILVTGAAGQLGAVGRTVTGLLLERGLPVRAMVRREDERAAALRASGAAGVRTMAARSLYSHKAGDRPLPAYAKPSGVPSWRSFCSSIANPRRNAPSRLLR